MKNRMVSFDNITDKMSLDKSDKKDRTYVVIYVPTEQKESKDIDKNKSTEDVK